jgi:hypothetical protein
MTNDVDAGFSAAWREKAARSMYVTSRHMLLGEVLRRARAGTLDQDWREHLTTYFPRLARAAGHHVALVERELIEPSPQPWEPYVAGGHWREALMPGTATLWHLRRITKQSTLQVRRGHLRILNRGSTGSPGTPADNNSKSPPPTTVGRTNSATATASALHTAPAWPPAASTSLAELVQAAHRAVGRPQ